jgi:peptide/nickel transport system ATP-binding protein
VLFITHDFGVVAEIADRVAVLRTATGRAGPDRRVLRAPQHDYTRMLIGLGAELTPRAARRPRRAPVVLHVRP